jgi:hypothetical protein
VPVNQVLDIHQKLIQISLVVEKRLESTNKKIVLCIGCLIMEERVFFRCHAGAFSQREKDRGKVWHHRNKYGIILGILKLNKVQWSWI